MPETVNMEPLPAMDSVEIPEYFLCPISLEIMKDPVTTAAGITYDRRSIERWLFVDNKETCPVTNQPLPKDSDLTPNHTLLRLIQGWCTFKGLDRIPTPPRPVDRAAVLALLRDLSSRERAAVRFDSLKRLAAFASESESNCRCMAQCGVAEAAVDLLVSCGQKKSQVLMDQIEVALCLLRSLQIPSSHLEQLVAPDGSYAVVESLTWILLHGSRDARANAMAFLRSVIDAATPGLLEKLTPDVFRALVLVVRDPSMPQQAAKAALHVLQHACPCGGNRTKIIEAGAVKEILELELAMPDKRTTELNLGVLCQLSACAEGRAQLVRHAAGIAVVSKRILRVSPVADEQGVRILSSLCRSSATNDVLQEMLRVGAVSKLCLVLQANCSSSVKETARGILKLNSGAWKHSPCISVYLLSRYH